MEDKFKAEAERVLREAHNNEHRETMELYSLIHNGILLLFVLILCCVFSLWLLILLPLYYKRND